MQKRIVATVAAVALAAVGTAVLLLYVQGAEQRALAGVEAVDVLVAREAIPKGTTAEDLGDRVASEKVASKLRPDGAVSDLDDLEGLVTGIDLVPGEQLLEGRFVEAASIRAASQVEIPDGLQVVTVSLTPDRAVGGQLSPGDTVGMVASFPDGAGGEGNPGPTAHLFLDQILIANVQGAPATQNEDGDASAAPGGDLLVSLAVRGGDAEKVVFAAENGALWLTSQTEGNGSDGTRIQTLKEIYQ